MKGTTNLSKPSESRRARLATLDELLATVIPAYLAPVPSRKTLGRWLEAAGINKLKANPAARRGGGTTWWHVAQVERMLRQKAGLIGHGEEGGAP